jgi:leucyl-tRNA synthetase
MESRYEPENVEAKARRFWDEELCFEVDEDPDK